MMRKAFLPGIRKDTRKSACAGALCLMPAVFILLAACGKKDEAESISGNTVTVSADEEISVDMPGLYKAVKYKELFFYIPEAFTADTENNEDREIYASPESSDDSYIMYVRTLNEKEDDYALLTSEDYSSVLSESLSANVAVHDFVNVVSPDTGMRTVKASAVIKKDDSEDHMTEYIYVTDDYVFTLVYMLETGTGWGPEYEKSMQSIELK